jgi:flagellar protein FliO/FliZ
VIAWALLALAQESPSLPSAVDGTVLRACAGVVLVLGLVIGLAILLRRGVLTLPGQKGARVLSVETALSLGDRRSVVVVNAEGRRFLLGLSPTQVNLLSELGPTRANFDRVLDRATSATPVEPA